MQVPVRVLAWTAAQCADDLAAALILPGQGVLLHRQLPKSLVGALDRQSLVSELNGVDNLPLPARFSHNQVGPRAQTLALRYRAKPCAQDKTSDGSEEGAST